MLTNLHDFTRNISDTFFPKRLLFWRWMDNRKGGHKTQNCEVIGKHNAGSQDLDPWDNEQYGSFASQIVLFDIQLTLV